MVLLEASYDIHVTYSITGGMDVGDSNQCVTRPDLLLLCGLRQLRNVVGKEEERQTTIHQNASYKHKEFGHETC